MLRSHIGLSAQPYRQETEGVCVRLLSLQNEKTLLDIGESKRRLFVRIMLDNVATCRSRATKA